MNPVEIALVRTYWSTVSNAVDPITIADELYQIGCLNRHQKHSIYELTSECVERSDIWKHLFILIREKSTIGHFLRALHRSEYTELAIDIAHSWRQKYEGPKQLCNRTNCDSNQRFAQRLFMSFKINTHNNIFSDPRKYCRGEATKYRSQLQTVTDLKLKAPYNIADRLTACLLGEIDSHIMLYEKKFADKNLFEDVKNLIAKTSNSNVTELSYHSRLAIAFALAGKHEDGEDHIQKAMILSTFIGRCVEMTNLLYIYVFLLLCIYEKNPTKIIRDKCLRISELGLQSVEDEEESIREFWLRILLLRMVYCLLGLSYRGDPIRGINVDNGSIRRAKILMTEVDKLWARMETRRKIMYFVAKGRISELEQKEDYLHTVKFYLDKAIKIGNEGIYGETQYVKCYRETIEYVYGHGSNEQIYSRLPKENDTLDANVFKTQCHSNTAADPSHVYLGNVQGVFENLSQPSISLYNDRNESDNSLERNNDTLIKCLRVDSFLPEAQEPMSNEETNRSNHDVQDGHLDLSSLMAENTLSDDSQNILPVECFDSTGNPRQLYSEVKNEPFIKLHK
ncbi:unnamed protein product [Mytilus coruscus]|uniref:Uncharacterized protein n=1 Tax=Mytilus coruscus TaxID=42192 RepID=A0A6J8A907_MYTCO|nr:unnamed protein product [Mytilus coruscus]